MAEPRTKAPVIGWPRKMRPKMALGTTSSANMTATRPEVM